MGKEYKKLKNKSFTVYFELRNVSRSPNKVKGDKYSYMFDIYIEGKLINKNRYAEARSINEVIYRINHKLVKEELKTRLKSKLFY